MFTNFDSTKWVSKYQTSFQNIISNVFVDVNGECQFDGVTSFTSITGASKVSFSLWIKTAEVPDDYKSALVYVGDRMYTAADNGGITLSLIVTNDDLSTTEKSAILTPPEYIMINGQPVGIAKNNAVIHEDMLYSGRNAVISFMLIVCGLTFLKMLRKHNLEYARAKQNV